MKYDSKKCNNLNFKLASGLSGFIKSAPNGDVYLYQNFCNWDPSTMTMMPVFWKTVKAEAFDAFVEDSGLSIVPRDPETYIDYKVGDRVFNKISGESYKIAAKLGDIVFLLYDNARVLTLSSELLMKYDQLVLTDYEQELLKAQKEKCPFKNGDRVLVRDNDDAPWQHDIFYFYEEESSHPYCCQKGQVKQCIPFNEHTWQLLDTTDEYKEDE